MTRMFFAILVRLSVCWHLSSIAFVFRGHGHFILTTFGFLSLLSVVYCMPQSVHFLPWTGTSLKPS
jgi:hypothetical protein